MPLPHSLLLSLERLEVPHDDGVRRTQQPDRLAVAVANTRSSYHPHHGSPDQASQRHPSRKVETYHEVSRGQRDVTPSAVRCVEHPLALTANRRNPCALHLRRNLNPARLPRQIINRIPRQPPAFTDLLGKRR